jgi:hypothetical protein
MKCSKCGQANSEGAAFCTHCGTALNQKAQLSDIDKQRIAEEEKERMKVREQLQASEKKEKDGFPKWAWMPIGCAGIVALIIIIVIATVVAPKSTKTSSITTTVYFNSSASQTPGVINVSYDDLYKLASTNEIAYDAEYKGKVLQMSSLKVVSVQSTANPRVNLVSAEGKSFTLYFASTVGLAQLTPGTLLTVQGTSDGVYFSEPSFDENCILVSAVQ